MRARVHLGAVVKYFLAIQYCPWDCVHPEKMITSLTILHFTTYDRSLSNLALFSDLCMQTRAAPKDNAPPDRKKVRLEMTLYP